MGPESVAGPAFGPGPVLTAAVIVDLVEIPTGTWGGLHPREEGKAQTMKHTAGTALRVGMCATLIGACIALLAGKDDIRKLHRMRSM